MPPGCVGQASLLAPTAAPTGAKAATPGVTGVSVTVGVKLGVMVIGGGSVGVAVVVAARVGRKLTSVAISTDVTAGVSVATMGITCGSGVAVMMIGVTVGGVSRHKPQPPATSATSPNAIATRIAASSARLTL